MIGADVFTAPHNCALLTVGFRRLLRASFLPSCLPSSPFGRVSLFFFGFGFPCCSLLFWYVPFILLHVLVSLQRFLRFCGLFLATRYAFCYVAVSLISRGPSILCLFLSILLLCFTILRFYSLFLSIMLLSFRYISCRFLCKFTAFMAFRFHFASMLLDSG